MAIGISQIAGLGRTIHYRRPSTTFAAEAAVRHSLADCRILVDICHPDWDRFRERPRCLAGRSFVGTSIDRTGSIRHGSSMSRAGRLFEVVQYLRRERGPTTAAELAGELGVSMRTLYRDVAALIARGVPIRGEPGVGYVLDPGYFLPPLTFGTNELDAVLLGLKWVEKRADPSMARAAVDAMAKIEAVLPRWAQDIADTPGVFVGPDLPQPVETVGTELFRGAVRGCRKVCISYCDANGVRTERTVWPIGLAFMEEGRAVMAWCELRGAFRYFHLERIANADVGAKYSERRAVLLQRCQQQIAAEQHDADTRCQESVL
ncbi:YafY family protein [Sphingomonas sp. GC_Shp_6]|nr:YafY family protein [Sphingomonas sp. GC_Shp_6]